MSTASTPARRLLLAHWVLVTSVLTMPLGAEIAALGPTGHSNPKKSQAPFANHGRGRK